MLNAWSFQVIHILLQYCPRWCASDATVKRGWEWQCHQSQSVTSFLSCWLLLGINHAGGNQKNQEVPKVSAVIANPIYLVPTNRSETRRTPFQDIQSPASWDWLEGKQRRNRQSTRLGTPPPTHNTASILQPGRDYSSTRRLEFSSSPANPSAVSGNATPQSSPSSSRTYASVLVGSPLPPPPPSPSIPTNTEETSPFSSTVKRECLEQIFCLVEKDTKLQKQWWQLSFLVSKVNRLNLLSVRTQLIPGVPRDHNKQYKLNHILQHLWKDLKFHLAKHENEFALAENNVFLQSHKYYNQWHIAIYTHLTNGPKDLLASLIRCRNGGRTVPIMLSLNSFIIRTTDDDQTENVGLDGKNLLSI